MARDRLADRLAGPFKRGREPLNSGPMIWLVFALLTGAAVLSVLAPLAGLGAARPNSKDAGASDVAFFEEQIAEIDRERAEGRLDPAEAEAARTEAARRLLRADGARGAAASASRNSARIAALAALALIPAIAVTLYLRLGRADMPDMPLTARLESAPARHDIAGAVTRIEEHLREHPNDGRGFEVVAPFYLRAGRFDDAVHAYGEALRLLGPTVTRHAGLGEARMLAAQGTVTQEARADFAAALALEPGHAMSRYYLGLAAAQHGERDKAVELWTKLLADAPPGAGYIGLVKAQLEKLGVQADEGPSGEQGKAVAALPDDERRATIRAMVERLARRLEQNGDDAEGWLKLMRAYSVLDEPEKAKQALADAHKALAGKAAETARVDALARELKIDE